MKEIIAVFVVLLFIAGLVGVFLFMPNSIVRKRLNNRNAGPTAKGNTLAPTEPSAGRLARIRDLEKIVVRLQQRLDEIESIQPIASAGGTISREAIKKIIQEENKAAAEKSRKKYSDMSKNSRHKKVDRIAKDKDWTDDQIDQIKAIFDEEASKRSNLYKGGNWSKETREAYNKLSLETFEAIAEIVGEKDAKLLHHGYWLKNRGNRGSGRSGSDRGTQGRSSGGRSSWNSYFESSKANKYKRIDDLAKNTDWSEGTIEQIKEILNRETDSYAALYSKLRSDNKVWTKEDHTDMRKIREDARLKLKELLGEQDANLIHARRSSRRTNSSGGSSSRSLLTPTKKIGGSSSKITPPKTP